jgi:uncharacterized protein
MAWHSVDSHFAIAGFIVGALVGVTGLGGGSLMTPILVLLFGVSPATAVGTDLLFAAATKTVGSFVHGFNKTIEWRVVRRLAAGSVPAAALALFSLTLLHMSSGGARHVITTILAVALLLTAGVLIARDRISARYAERLGALDERSVALLTIAMGAVLGFLVTFSSIGAGAIGVTALVLLYPRIPMARIVGSDIAHAVPLTLVAGVGHGAMGSLDPHTLLCLLVGSLPGIFVGSWVSSHARDVALRYILAGVLIIVGTSLAFDIPGHARPDSGGRDHPIPLSSVSQARSAVEPR